MLKMIVFIIVGYLALWGAKDNVELVVQTIHLKWPDFPMRTFQESRDLHRDAWSNFNQDVAYRDGALMEKLCEQLDKLVKDSHVCLEHKAKMHIGPLSSYPGFL